MGFQSVNKSSVTSNTGVAPTAMVETVTMPMLFRTGKMTMCGAEDILIEYDNYPTNAKRPEYALNIKTS